MRKKVKKRGIHLVCEHFEPFCTAKDTWHVFEAVPNINLQIRLKKGWGLCVP
jgi:hypothetical protein